MEDEELPDLDFGEIHCCHVPPECCSQDTNVTDENSSSEEQYQNHVIDNQKLIAHLDDPDACGNDRYFTVNLHRDGSWSFTFTNGEELTQDQLRAYCDEITGAQSQLATWQQWKLRGRGLGIWDPKYNSGAGSGGANADDSTAYYPAGNSGPKQGGSCVIMPPANLNVRPGQS